MVWEFTWHFSCLCFTPSQCHTEEVWVQFWLWLWFHSLLKQSKILQSKWKKKYQITFFQPIFKIVYDNLILQDITVGSFSNVFEEVAKISKNPDMMKIAERFFTHYDFVTAFQNASEGKIVMGEGRRMLEYNQRKKFTNE